MFSKAAYTQKVKNDPLKLLVSEALTHLRNSIIDFKYPKAVQCKHGRDAWKANYKSIDELNETILESIKGRGGVYAIHIARPGKDWHLKYIGQAKAALSRQRIRSHLVWRNKETLSGRFTGSKFTEIQDAVCSGYDVAITFVEIEPESLRHYVEEELLKKKNPEWNLHSTTLRRQQISMIHCSL